MSCLTGNKPEAARVGLGSAVLCVAQFVVVLDATIVATAVPTIGTELRFSASHLSWVITAYTAVLAGLLILGGRAADLVGARRVFRVGLAVFTLASIACAVAWSPSALLAARVLQGAGAALLSPAALAALTGLVTDARARGRMLGWWTAAGAGGGASGWVLGGVVTELAGWRWVFAVNVPLGLVSWLISRRALPTRARRSPSGLSARSLDLPGSVLATAGIGLACLGATLVGERPGATVGWAALGAAAVSLVAFVHHERLAADPLVPGALLRTRGVVGGNVTAATLTGATTPAMLTAILYVQQTAHLSPARGSLLFPAFNLAVIAGSLLSPSAVRRVGPRLVLLAGFSAVVAGIALLLALPAQGVPVALLLTSFAVTGAGLGWASVASTTAGTIAVDPGHRGVAAGLLNSTAQLGQALGLAAISPLVASAAPMAGYRLGFGLSALVGLAGAVAAAGLVRRLRSDPADGARRADEPRVGSALPE